MQAITYYTFFDSEAIDPLWRITWKELFCRYPRSRTEIAELIEDEPKKTVGHESDCEDMEDVFEKKTVAWTIRRCTSPFYTMSYIIDIVPALRKHRLDIKTYYIGDSFALVAAGIDSWVRGVVGERTLHAILKLHNFEERSLHCLNLPKWLFTKLKQMASPEMLSKPLYSWQGSEACQSDNYGLVDNCLKVAETRRFLAFLERAWQEDQPVPFVESLSDCWELSAETTLPTFRELELTQRFMAKRKAIRRFERPCMVRMVCDG